MAFDIKKYEKIRAAYILYLSGQGASKENQNDFATYSVHLSNDKVVKQEQRRIKAEKEEAKQRAALEVDRIRKEQEALIAAAKEDAALRKRDAAIAKKKSERISAKKNAKHEKAKNDMKNRLSESSPRNYKSATLYRTGIFDITDTRQKRTPQPIVGPTHISPTHTQSFQRQQQKKIEEHRAAVAMIDEILKDDSTRQMLSLINKERVIEKLESMRGDVNRMSILSQNKNFLTKNIDERIEKLKKLYSSPAESRLLRERQEAIERDKRDRKFGNKYPAKVHSYPAGGMNKRR